MFKKLLRAGCFMFVMLYACSNLFSATISSAKICVNADDKATVYINGNLIGTFAYVNWDAAGQPPCMNVPASALNATGTNTIAVLTTDTAGGEIWSAWSMDVTFSDGSHSYVSSNDDSIKIAPGYDCAAPPDPAWYAPTYNPSWGNAVLDTGTYWGKPMFDPGAGKRVKPWSYDAGGSAGGHGCLFMRQGVVLNIDPTPMPPNFTLSKIASKTTDITTDQITFTLNLCNTGGYTLNDVYINDVWDTNQFGYSSSNSANNAQSPYGPNFSSSGNSVKVDFPNGFESNTCVSVWFVLQDYSWQVTDALDNCAVRHNGATANWTSGTKAASTVTLNMRCWTMTPTYTNTYTQTPTKTPTATFTSTFTYTPTRTYTWTFTMTSTPTFSPTRTPTQTFTFTATFTNTFTRTPTLTYTPTPSPTPIPPVFTLVKSANKTANISAGDLLTFTLHLCNTGGPVSSGTLTLLDDFTSSDGTWVYDGPASTNNPITGISNYNPSYSGGKTTYIVTFVSPGFTGCVDIPMRTHMTALGTACTWNNNASVSYLSTPSVVSTVKMANLCTSPTPTVTKTPTASFTRTYTNTVNPSPTYTRTATATQTRTMTPTFTDTRTNTQTYTRTSTSTNTPSRTPTPTFTITTLNTATATPSRTPSFTATQTFTQTYTRTSTPTHTQTRTPTPTFTITTLNTATATPTRTPTFTATPTFSVTRSPTPTFSRTSTSTYTPTYTATPTATITSYDTATSTKTITPTSTATRTFTPTWTVTNTPSVTATPSITITTLDTATSTPSRTQTFTRTESPTNTATLTCTETRTATSTVTETKTATPTVTQTSMSTATDTPTDSPTPTVTLTPTDTRTPSPTFTETSIYTFTRTATETKTETASFTYTLTATGTKTETATMTPTATPSCTYTNVPTIAPSPLVYPYNFTLEVYNAAGERVKIIGQATINALMSGFDAMIGNTVTSVFNATEGSMTFRFPGIWTDEQINVPYVDFSWDGTNDNGQNISQGVYYIKAMVLDEYGHTKATIKEIQLIRSEKYVRVSIYNSSGELVKRIEQSYVPGMQVQVSLETDEVFHVSGGNNSTVIKLGAAGTMEWDGKNALGSLVSSGIYEISMELKQSTSYTLYASKTMAVLNESSGPIMSAIKAYPNPAMAGEGSNAVIHFQWLATSKGKVTIRVYDVAGGLVAKIDAKIEDLFVDWDMTTQDGSRLAGGLYAAVIEALTQPGVREKTTIKLAVIRR